MSASKIILGIDGGLAHLGWSVSLVREGEPGTVIDAGCIETVKRHDETSATSHAQRSVEVCQALRAVIAKHAPNEICAEAFSPPRDSRNASMLAWSWGVICTLAHLYSLPIRAKGPMPLKKAFTGDRCAKKPEMIAAAQKLYPESQAFFPRRRPDLHEHIADAIAAFHFFHGDHAA
jgi:Holliday junction resolvasome RuvABC endonuclease subunit